LPIIRVGFNKNSRSARISPAVWRQQSRRQCRDCETLLIVACLYFVLSDKGDYRPSKNRKKYEYYFPNLLVFFFSHYLFLFLLLCDLEIEFVKLGGNLFTKI
jgi:hypothetical protein